MSKARKFDFKDDFDDYSYREEEKSHDKKRRADAKKKQARKWQDMTEWSEDNGTESN